MHAPAAAAVVPLPWPHLVWAVHLKLNAHLAAGLIGVLYRVHQCLVLVVGVVLSNHHVQHHTRVAAKAAAAAAQPRSYMPLTQLELHASLTA